MTQRFDCVEVGHGVSRRLKFSWEFQFNPIMSLSDIAIDIALPKRRFYPKKRRVMPESLWNHFHPAMIPLALIITAVVKLILLL